MSGSNQPFTDHVTRAQRTKGSMPAWIAAGVATLAAIVVIILWSSASVRERQETESLRSQMNATSSALAGALAENQTNRDALAALKDQIANLQMEKEAAAHTSKSLEDEMRSQLESRDVTISNLQGSLTVNILDRVMFDSGEAVLKPDGEAVMRKVAGILTEHPQLSIQVVGHTDNVPIRPNAHTRFASNWELSTARALAAVHFLTEQANVDPRHVGAAGYGEFHPVADNSTPEGRAKNRRITITILPDELNASGPAPAPAPAPKPTVSTNAPSGPALD